MKLFVITGSSGEYSDRNDWNICACYSEDRANEILEKIKRLHEYKGQFEKRVREEFLARYKIDHPYPRIPGVSYNKWGQVRGPERGDKQAQIKHQRQLEEHSMLIRAYSNNRHDAEDMWRKANYIPPFDYEDVKNLHIGSHNQLIDYGFEELDIL